MRCSDEVDRLRERRKEVEDIGDPIQAVQKQQTVFFGDILDLQDMVQFRLLAIPRRVTMHLEGKIHKGF